MAPPRARMTNDRSTGVAGKVKLAGIGTGRRLLENKPLDAAYNADCAVKYGIWMQFGCETMANAAEASASTARPRKKKAAQGETPAARRNGANKGTVKGREGESSRLPENEPMTGTLEHRASRRADRLVLNGETREGRYWERSAKEKTDESRNPQRVRVAGA